MMKQSSKNLAALAIVLIGAVAATAAKKNEKFPLWNGKQSVADYAKRAKLKPTDTLDFGDGVKVEMVLIPAGTFTMGSPDSEEKTDEHKGKEPLHKVTITRPFYMSKYELTQPQYEKVAGANPSQNKGDRYPVTRVSWEQAIEFARKAADPVRVVPFTTPWPRLALVPVFSAIPFRI